MTKVRDKARTVPCMANQRQIALAVQTWSQDHEETLPEAATVWDDLDIDRKVLTCPQRPSMRNAYLYSINIAGRPLGDFTTTPRKGVLDPVNEIVTIDGLHHPTGENLAAVPPVWLTHPNVYYSSEDIEYRHGEQFVASYLDGHVEVTTVTPTQDIRWSQCVGTTVSYPTTPATGTRLAKTAAGDGWNTADAVGDQLIGSTGTVIFKFEQTDKAVAVGLVKTEIAYNTDRDYATFDYAILGAADGHLHVYEANVDKGDFGAYATDDVFAIRRVGSTVFYLKNDDVFYTSKQKFGGSLAVDTSFDQTGGAITNCRYYGAG
ncbi:MAG: hypothetical protein ACYDCO_06725 [Armatimonadota bacterium]